MIPIGVTITKKMIVNMNFDIIVPKRFDIPNHIFAKGRYISGKIISIINSGIDNAINLLFCQKYPKSKQINTIAIPVSFAWFLSMLFGKNSRFRFGFASIIKLSPLLI